MIFSPPKAVKYVREVALSYKKVYIGRLNKAEDTLSDFACSAMIRIKVDTIMEIRNDH
jgi:hypothetical protein